MSTLHQKKIFFSQEHRVLFEQPASSVSMVVDCLPSWLKYYRYYSGNFPTDVKPHWSKKLKMACHITIHEATTQRFPFQVY